MKTTIDYRNDTWADVQPRVRGLQLAVYEALLRSGPCTTRELARRSGIDILTVRPRVTELCQLEWIALVDDDAGGHEGTYRALTLDEAKARFERRKAQALGRPVQAEMAL